MANGKINVAVENIFPLIKKFLYSDHEIFLRELISNATDAISKLKHLSSVGEVKGEIGDPRIEVKIDKKNKLSKLIGASVTPEAFLICRDSGKILFHGAIDNWFYSLGKKRSVITANYFEDALKQLLNNEKIRVPFAQPVGCYIE